MKTIALILIGALALPAVAFAQRLPGTLQPAPTYTPTIPSRTTRTATSAQAGAAQPADPAVQWLNMAAQAELAKQQGKVFPPLLPMPGTHRTPPIPAGQ